MSRVFFKDRSVVKELLQALMAEGLTTVGNVVVPVALTAAAIAIVYTTDDPVTVENQAVTIADGDAVSVAELMETIDEINLQITRQVADILAVHTALSSCVTAGAANTTPPAALTSHKDVCVFTYTTDDPAITVNQAITIADGDTISNAEVHEGHVELIAELVLSRADISRAHAAVTSLINDGIQVAPVLAVRTTTNGGIALTYTTDDPAITPNNTITIADGDLLTSVNANEYFEEANDDLDKLGDDFTALKTAYDLLLVASARPTS